MNKVSILLLGLAITLVAGQCDHPLITTFGYTALGAAATPAGGAASLSFCKVSLPTTVCCEDADINGIQTQINTVKTDLENLVKIRDPQLLAARAALAEVASNLTAFKTAATNAQTALAAMTGNADAATVAASATLISTYITSFITGYSTLWAGFSTYQKARVTCFDEILKTQAAVFCFACDPDYATKGVDDSTDAITLSTTVETRLRDACFPYIDAAIDQNVIFELNSHIDNIDAMTAALVLIAGTDSAAATAAVTTYVGFTRDLTIDIAELPASCTSTACTWISADIRTAGQIDKALFNLGGDKVSARRILEQGRALVTTGEFAPTTDAAGVTIAFAENPADVTNVVDDLSSVIRNGVISCIAAVFVTLLV